MAVAVILPKLDEAMRTGKITKWAKKEGEQENKKDTSTRKRLHHTNWTITKGFIFK